MTLVVCRCRQCGETYKHDASKESPSMEDFLLSRESYPVDFGICHTCMQVMEDALIKNKRVRDPNIPLELPPADLSHHKKKKDKPMRLVETHNIFPVILLILCSLTLVLSVVNLITSVNRNNALSAQVKALETTPHYQGKDANGNEVWAPAVTVIELNKKQ